jgi:hypothetical protein
MATIKLHAGDWGEGQGRLVEDLLLLPEPGGLGTNEHLPLSSLHEIELASEESVMRLGGTIGWGAVGALALGPVGLLAGLLLGGRGTDVTFVANFKDGRKMLATTDSRAFTRLKAAVF